MPYDFSLDRKRIVLLSILVLVLLALVFVFGWLLGVRSELSSAAASAPAAGSGHLFRAKIPQPIKKAMPKAPKLPAVKAPAIKAPKLPNPAPSTPAAAATPASSTPSPAAPTPPAADTAKTSTDTGKTAPAATPPTAPAAGTEKKTPAKAETRYPYSLHMASYPDAKTAEKALPKYSGHGAQAYIAKVDLGRKGLWWRVYVGHYASRDDAEAAAKQMNATDAVITRTPFANLVGTYPDEAGADEDADRVRSKGYTPYTIVKSDGRTYLYAGAFITRQGADDNLKWLNQDGISSKVVLR